MIKKPQGKVVSASMLTLTVLIGFSRGFEVFCESSAEKTLFKAVLGTINWKNKIEQKLHSCDKL